MRPQRYMLSMTYGTLPLAIKYILSNVSNMFRLVTSVCKDLRLFLQSPVAHYFIPRLNRTAMLHII